MDTYSFETKMAEVSRPIERYSLDSENKWALQGELKRGGSHIARENGSHEEPAGSDFDRTSVCMFI